MARLVIETKILVFLET